MNKKSSHNTAVYAGTFDPITNGHKDVVERSLRIFDHVIVAVAQATPKNVLFNTVERKQMVIEALRDLEGAYEVVSFDGLLVDYVRKVGAQTIIRGLRAISDYEYEAQMALINRRLSPDVETVFLMTSEHCSFISSRIVKEIAANGGDPSPLVPPHVALRLREKFQTNQ